MLNLPNKVTIVEVGPRDGLQSFPDWVDTETKVRMIDRLSEAGYPVIEATNFAHPKVIPNLKDAEEVMERITRRPGTVYRALVPNARGAGRKATRRVRATATRGAWPSSSARSPSSRACTASKRRAR